MTEQTVQSSVGYTLVTRGVRVSVVPAALTEESNPTKNSYAFSYTITIENLSDKTAQLLERHWKVYSAERRLTEVVGPGVVGKQPVLEPGHSFTYTSGAVINDPYGAMEGAYTFRAEDGEFFEVTIPRFDFLYPVMIH